MSGYPTLQPGPAPPAYDGGGYNPQSNTLAPPAENTTYGMPTPTSPSTSPPPQSTGPSYANYHDNPQQYQTYDKPMNQHGSVNSNSTGPGYPTGGYTGGGYQTNDGYAQQQQQQSYGQQQQGYGPPQQAPMICPGVVPTMGPDGRIMSNDPEDTPGKVMCAQVGCLCAFCVPIVGPITFCVHMSAPPQSRRKKWAKFALITGLVMMTIGIICSISVGSNRRRY